MGKLIIGFIYFIIIGFVSVLFKIFGINPFAGKKDVDSYWLNRSDNDSPPYEFTLKDKIDQQTKQGGQN